MQQKHNFRHYIYETKFKRKVFEMKKFMVFVLALIFILCFASCNEPEKLPNEPEENISEPVTESLPQSEEQPETVPEELPEEESIPEIDGKPISEEEIDFFNKLFEVMILDEKGNYETNPWSCFFTSYYHEIVEMNFYEFMYYFPGDGIVTDEEEFEALKQTEAWPFGMDAVLERMPVPVHKYPAEKVNAVLEEYAGIAADDLDVSTVPYLEEYDCYYGFSSDYGPGMFICTGGERIGNTVYLYEESEQGTDMLVLIEDDNSYKVVSHQHFANP